MERLHLGDITIDRYSDGELSCPLLQMLPGADAAMFRELGGCADGETLTLPLTSYVLRSGGRTVLVDTGIGPSLGSLARAFSGEVGLLPARLAEAGVSPETVDAVVFTHLHADHIGWNVIDRDGEIVPMFPNAEYIVSRAEWAFWGASESKDIARCVRTVEQRGQLRAVDDGFEAAPGISLLATPGHTPGHAAVLVFAGGQGAVITGDAAHHPGEFEDPQLNPPYDADVAMAKASRSALADRAEADGLLVLGGHFPAPGMGTLVRVEGKRRWRWS